jgi:hypothetical protein
LKVAGFLLAQGATEEGQLAIAEPFFQDLVAAEGLVPDVDGDGGPVGGVVEVDVDAAMAEERERVFEGERLRGLGVDVGGELCEAREFGWGPVAFAGVAATGHDGGSLACAAPAGGEGEAGGVVVVVLLRGGAGLLWRDGEAGEEAPLGVELEVGFGVEQVGEPAAECGGAGEQVGGGGERDAGPVAEECAGVFGAVLRGVHCGQCMEEEVLMLTCYFCKPELPCWGDI